MVDNRGRRGTGRGVGSEKDIERGEGGEGEYFGRERGEGEGAGTKIDTSGWPLRIDYHY